ncbi:AMP binding protein [Auricularia subglabra TFB-10046 SS5]|nr:AMP binding protein [Auricularia subglabra TFB-10046 SS5]
MKIYTSPYPAEELARCSIFHAVFPTPDRHADRSAIFIDATTGYVVKRGDFRDLALALGYGVTNYAPSKAPGGLLSSVLHKHRGLPLRQGQVALVFMPNGISYPLVFYGLQAAGIRTTLANASYTPRELAHQLRDSAAEVAFVHPALLPVLEKAWSELGLDAAQMRARTVIVDWEPWNRSYTPDPKLSGWISINTLLSLGALPKAVSFDGDKSNETAMMCYSSGTTGLAKGVETTHYNVTSIVNIHRRLLLFTPDEVVLGVLPFYHIFAAVLLTIYYPTYNVPVVIQSAFTPDSFCANIAKYKVTMSLVVPPILLALAKHPAPDQHDMSTFHRAVCGAAPLSASLCSAVINRLEKLGCKDVVISQGYGLTETSPSIFYLVDEHARRKVGTTGELLPHLQVRIVEDGPEEKDAAEGQPGELWIRGPTVMKGYLNNPKATKEVITKDGFFKTGDICVRDSEGFYSIVDRKKELIKYKGFQVPPAELEAVLISNPEILDAAVIGVYSQEQETELPRAYIVHAKGLAHFKTSDEKAKFEAGIAKWIETKVAKHKFLRGGVVVIDAIPKSAAGKILRRQLRDRVKAETGRDPITGAPVRTKSKL